MTRLLGAFCVASLLAFVAFWVGARIAVIVDQPERQQNDFTVGQKMSLCGRVIDTRHQISGYDFDEWQGRRCDQLSKLDECLLECLSNAGTIEIGAACYSRCVSE